MKKAKLNFLVIEDISIAGSTSLKECEKRYIREMEEATGGEVTVSFDHIQKDLSIIEWDSNTTYPNFNWCSKQWGNIIGNYDDAYHFVYYIVSHDNWKAPSYAGLHRGIFGSSHKPAISFNFAKYYPNPDHLWLAFTMEPAHSFDSWTRFRDYKLDINEVFDVADYDEDVVHGRDSRYTRYEYKHVYKKIKDALIAWFPCEDCPEETMQKVLHQGEVYLRDSQGRDWHVTNPYTLTNLTEMGVVKDEPAEEVGSINPTGKEVAVMPEE